MDMIPGKAQSRQAPYTFVCSPKRPSAMHLLQGFASTCNRNSAPSTSSLSRLTVMIFEFFPSNFRLRNASSGKTPDR